MKTEIKSQAQRAQKKTFSLRSLQINCNTFFLHFAYSLQQEKILPKSFFLRKIKTVSFVIQPRKTLHLYLK